MSAFTTLPGTQPRVMTIMRAGSGITRAPEGISNRPFLMQALLSGGTDGDLTGMRAFVEPGGVTHWHTHPRGQLLFVLDGVGLVRREGGEIEEVRAGDCVWFAPGERHWHGATPVSPFGYVSVQPIQDGAAVRWLEPVEGRAACP